MIVDNFDEMLEQSRAQPLVMGIALHPYLVGQPYRLRHLRRALEHVARARDAAAVWLTHARRDLRAHGGAGRRAAARLRVSWAVDDRVGAWVPHGRFVIEGAAQRPAAGPALRRQGRLRRRRPSDRRRQPDLAGHPSVPAPQHARIVERVLAAGATLLGKVITDELAFSLHGDNVHYGTPLNSAAPDSVPGGSSSGSAAAVAARLVDFALATDTGGSTRVPASYCGLWGLRTTQGLVSTRGLVPLAPGFDTATWLAHDAATFARVGEVLLPEARLVPRQLIVLDDAWALADPPSPRRWRRREGALWPSGASRRATSVPAATRRWRPGAASTRRWRRGRAGGAHGDWIDRAAAAFRSGDRGPLAGRAGDQRGACRRSQPRRRRDQRARARRCSAPTASPCCLRRQASRRAAMPRPSAVDAVRLRTMAITCIAGLAGLPQVSIPFVAATPDASLPVGVSLLGPPGSDRALIAIATAVREALP